MSIILAHFNFLLIFITSFMCGVAYYTYITKDNLVFTQAVK
jgi:hypothetical protein